jgi:hypothetical protein
MDIMSYIFSRYRVQLVTENFVTKTPSPPPQVPTLLGEFPELGSPVKPKSKIPEAQESTGEVTDHEEAGSPSKRPVTKRRDPIVVDLHKMIVPVRYPQYWGIPVLYSYQKYQQI